MDITKYLAAALLAGVIVAAPLSASAAQNGQRNGAGQGRQNQQQASNSAPLSDDEKRTILRTIEEEKFAGDLYRAFYEKWGTAVFSRIANSEDKHEQASYRLVTTYGLTDPRKSETGKFTDQSLQQLYDGLLVKGMTSEKAALEVAKQFEVDDIAGLKAAQKATDETRLDRVYGNLQRASENHLREFTEALR